jgi:hypothetical protein
LRASMRMRLMRLYASGGQKTLHKRNRQCQRQRIIDG